MLEFFAVGQVTKCCYETQLRALPPQLAMPLTHPTEIKILSALAQSKAEINGKILRNHVITLREIVRSGSERSLCALPFPQSTNC